MTHPTPAILVRLDRRDGPFAAACILGSVVSLALVLRWHDETSPTASIDFEVTHVVSEVTS